METQRHIHKIFDPFFYPKFLETYMGLRTVNPNGVIIVIVDHSVHNDFFWEMNSFLIENLPSNEGPIIPLPHHSNDEEFMMLIGKMKHGALLIDKATFQTLTFRTRNPYYFFSDRILIHKSGEISYITGKKF